MRYILAFIFFIVLFSCNNKSTDKELDRAFINSYSELDENCIDIIDEFLKPYDFDSDALTIDKVFRLDVSVDTTIYSKYDLSYNYFIGVKLKPDLYDLIVFDVDLKIGAVSLCQILPNDELIINNMDYLFTDLTPLSNCTDLKIPDTLTQSTSNQNIMFRNRVWRNTTYRYWEPDTIKQSGFKDKILNNIWIFTPEKKFILMNQQNDTLLVDDFEQNGYDLKLIESGYKFEIGTQTRTNMLIKNRKEKKYVLLSRINY